MKTSETNSKDFSLKDNINEPIYTPLEVGDYIATIAGIRVDFEANELHITLNADGVQVVHWVRSNFVRKTIDDLARQVGGAPTLQEFLKNLIGKEVAMYLWYKEYVSVKGTYSECTNIEYITKERREHREAFIAAETAKREAANTSIR